MMHLKLAVLKLLDDQPRSGYDLMKALQEQIGRKPSPGSVYPLLEQLKTQGEITCKKAGRRKFFQLPADSVSALAPYKAFARLRRSPRVSSARAASNSRLT